MLSVTDSPTLILTSKVSAEIWAIRVGGLILFVMALLTLNSTSTTEDKVNKQNQQIDALYDALQQEQQAKMDEGGIPVTPPAAQLRENPSLIVDHR